MKICHVKIHNWRSIRDEDIVFQDLMIFIGKNNHGKSNVLSAILFFFGQITAGDLDFYRGSEELYVEVTFDDLDDHDKGQFKKYLTAENRIKVRKNLTKGGTFEYHGYCEIPSDEWLKEENVSNYTTRDAVAATPLNAHVPATGRLTKDLVRQAQEAYISANRGSIAFNYDLEASNFLGLKSVAQGIFGDVFLIPAVKHASSELETKGKSIFSMLLAGVINEMSTESDAYRAAKEKIAELTKGLNKITEAGEENPDRPPQLKSLEEKLESELKNWNTKIDIEITPPDIDEALKVGTSVWIDDGVRTDVNRKGTGLQRSLIFALIKSWAALLREKKEAASAAPAEGEEGGTPRAASKSTYFIFEEPELYLHPQAQRELFASLRLLPEANNQVLLSTHSSAFIDLELYKSICIVYKDNIETGTKCLQCTDELFSLADEKKNFNLAHWINPDRGELFFAKKVLLVEGPTDKVVIPFLAKQLGVFRYDYSLIECGGKDTMPIYIHLLNKFRLPYVVAYDKDHQSHKDANGIASATTSSGLIEAKIDTAIGSSIIFVNDIEEELGVTSQSDKNKPYAALQTVSDTAFTITPSLKGKIEGLFA